MSAGQPLKLAIAGLGTVGAATGALIRGQADLLMWRAGRPLVLRAVSARDRAKPRGFALEDVAWFADPVAMAREADADVIVELIGGADGAARATVEAALAAKRHVVTANKALLAHHGNALARTAEAAGLVLAYEAAVAGGIPIIKAVREGLAANDLTRVYGILNGTCNYILTTMRESGREFADVLAEAQKLGYAEADPSFDVDGVDAAHKLAILAAVAFGAAIDFPALRIEGIRHVSAADIAYADELGYRIKLLGIAHRSSIGLEQRVQPCMVPVGSPIAQVDGVFNAVVAEGDAVGMSFYQGRGAGAGPTASAVVADLIDIARGHRVATFNQPAASLKKLPAAPSERHRGAFYIRLMVVDRPGVIADVAAALRDESVSLESMLQRGRDPGAAVAVVLTTHETEEGAMKRALERIGRLDAVVEPPRVIRIIEAL
ncbi:MAG: homoserine dehydrogenase [Proteobacteria bacterium]|nr:homoserine dehydrogenase [Pseudomonadota bacterium]